MAFSPFYFVNTFTGINGLTRRLALAWAVSLNKNHPKLSGVLLNWAVRKSK